MISVWGSGCIALDLITVGIWGWVILRLINMLLLLLGFCSFDHLQWIRWQQSRLLLVDVDFLCPRVVHNSDGLRRCPWSTVNEIGDAVQIAIVSTDLVLIRRWTSFNVDYRWILNYMVTFISLVRLLIVLWCCNKQSYRCSWFIDLHLAMTLVLLSENTLAHFDAFIVEHVFFSGKLLKFSV